MRMARNFATQALLWLESLFAGVKEEKRSAPIFIFGVPRSGTTLLYQAITRKYKTAYFCNLANRFFLCPGLVTVCASFFRKLSPPDCFSSHYGKSASWASPSQGNKIWSRWFHGPQVYHVASDVDDAKLQEMRDTIYHIQKTMGGVFVNKSIGHSVRLAPLLKAFPDAMLIHVTRDQQQVAESILCGRRECFGDEEHWFSVRPKQFDDIVKKPYVQQVCEQVHWVRKNIEEDLISTHCSRVFTVSYEEFCKMPLETCQKIDTFYFEKTGHSLEAQNLIPETFTASFRSKVTAQEKKEIADYFCLL